MIKESMLKLVEKVDTFPYNGIGDYKELITHDGKYKIGYLTPDIANRLGERNDLFIIQDNGSIRIKPEFNKFEDRNNLISNLAKEWRKLPGFEEQLDKGWRDELYIVYCPSKIPYMLVERSFSLILGIITYGVHINGFINEKNSSNGKLKLWIPRRSLSRPTFPGMLDNTIAGGIGFPNDIWQTVLKESNEEAGLSPDFIYANTRSVGCLLYIYQSINNNQVQPEIEFIYDIEFKNENDIIPYPIDGETENYKLMDINEVMKRLIDNEFKPNCSLVIIDFLIRHGYITPETEPNFHEILTRIHRKMPFPIF